MPIKTLKDYKNKIFKQHPIYYILILIFCVSICSHGIYLHYRAGEYTAIVTENVITGEDRIEEYSVSDADAKFNQAYIEITSRYVFPIIVLLQISILYYLIVLFIDLVVYQNIDYMKNLLWFIYGFILIVLFVTFLFLSAKAQTTLGKSNHFAFSAFAFVIEQIFFFKIWRKYVKIDFYIECHECTELIEVNKQWFKNSNLEESVEFYCKNCKKVLCVSLELAVEANKENLFYWPERYKKT